MISRDSSKSKPGRLEGKTIFLSASIPSLGRDKIYQQKYWKDEIPDDWIEVEQAVIGLCRAVFSEDGRLVFGGHPTITPLVASVAAEYYPPQKELGLEISEGNSDEQPVDDNSAPVVVYQSRAFKGFDKSWMLRRLGYAAVRWTRVQDNEHYDATQAKLGPPCPKSVTHMRQVMLRQTRPDAMVCIGGMEGVEREAELYRDMIIEAGIRRTASIYALATTGGAAKLLTEESSKIGKHLRAIDVELLGKPDTRPRFIPYAVVMQRIVDELAGLRHRG